MDSTVIAKSELPGSAAAIYEVPGYGLQPVEAPARAARAEAPGFAMYAELDGSGLPVEIGSGALDRDGGWDSRGETRK